MRRQRSWEIWGAFYVIKHVPGEVTSKGARRLGTVLCERWIN
jgi:hypothetical protein